MAKVGQIYYNIIDNNSGQYISNVVSKAIYDDIVALQGAKQFNKLGVQAPPGTHMILNGTKSIMVGRTGMYELDDDIAITEMYFVKPKKYIKDEEASNEAIESGSIAMLTAESNRATAMSNLKSQYPSGPPNIETNPSGNEAYWNQYNTIQANYIIAYEQGLSTYNHGMNGIYTLPNPNNPDDESNYQEIYNVIVDFIYE